MISHDIVGLELPAHQAVVERGHLRFFAETIGETNPVFLDETAARAAGHPSIPVPATLLFSLNLLRRNHEWRDSAGIQLKRILHGEQAFTYHRLAYAGDTLNFRSRICDVYEKKSGALSFIVTETHVSNQHGEHVADLRSTLVHRND